MKTILGEEIPETTRGILYLCHFDYEKMEITVLREILFADSYLALMLYAEIFNPASQVVMGKTFEELCAGLERLHKDMKDPVWLEDLANCL
jgi:hypothetical protein